MSYSALRACVSLGGRHSPPPKPPRRPNVGTVFFWGDSLPSPHTPWLVFFMVLFCFCACWAGLLWWCPSLFLFWSLRGVLSVFFSYLEFKGQQRFFLGLCGGLFLVFFSRFLSTNRSFLSAFGLFLSAYSGLFSCFSRFFFVPL